jgi:hypothetical protein
MPKKGFMGLVPAAPMRKRFSDHGSWRKNDPNCGNPELDFIPISISSV